ncbi:RDD family protein [Catenuloplanes atrovinosus]|uniref:RDD family membrane protein YckC n=1 Tax=Catenuloplanes atrovinosus TaxID=137266 RepID=A0AAE4CAP2_9ACTN|nr:RDD family protein [Catenuloplanes atrovinosus]MDR7277258.1 putative RDD family membrane protein YckC [Catenuloplanes atrovinosus]
MSAQSQYPQHPEPASAEPLGPNGRPLAGLGPRLGARLLDSAINLVAMSSLAGLIGGGLALLAASTAGHDSPVVPITAISTILLVVIAFQYVYEVEMPLRWHGQTPGKRLLKIALTSREPGVALSRSALTSRLLVMLAANVLSNCGIGLLDPLWCLWDKPYRQCLHDKPAKTVVVQA